ncbi:MAG TPA: hypothetical protein [Caudoviricetes sp.]|nr:MAG TPA: hypothetical protein [Caudoviricetes sp.]
MTKLLPSLKLTVSSVDFPFLGESLWLMRTSPVLHISY